MKTALVLLSKSTLFSILFISLYVLSSEASAVKIGNGNANSDFVVGYANHPRVISYYKPLIERAYRDIGIKVKFEQVGGERGLRLLNEGMTDADVIRYSVVAEPNTNIVVVPPALSKGA